MFEHLDFSKIFVTGPQRSGTTICAKMISHDTGLKFYPEGAVAVKDKRDEEFEALKRFNDSYDSFVIQCPIQCRYIHRFSASDTLIVMMIRDLGAIKRSEQRIGWGDARQRALYSDVIKDYGLNADLPIAQVKYSYWNIFQKSRIEHFLDIKYESLQQHPLWVPPRRRYMGYWGPRTISVDDRSAEEMKVRPLV